MVETEPMVINGEIYKWYPKIREEDIGKNTGNKFIDTCSIANPYCKLMLADYDGDQLTLAAVRDPKLAKYFKCFNPVNMFIDRATGQFDPAMDFKKDYAAVLSSLWTMDTKINDYIMDPNETTYFDLSDIGIEVHNLPDDEIETPTPSRSM